MNKLKDNTEFIRKIVSDAKVRSKGDDTSIFEAMIDIAEENDIDIDVIIGCLDDNLKEIIRVDALDNRVVTKRVAVRQHCLF